MFEISGKESINYFEIDHIHLSTPGYTWGCNAKFTDVN